VRKIGSKKGRNKLFRKQTFNEVRRRKKTEGGGKRRTERGKRDLRKSVG